MNWPEPIEHEQWCPVLRGIGKCACHAGDINDMLEDCKDAYEKECKCNPPGSGE